MGGGQGGGSNEPPEPPLDPPLNRITTLEQTVAEATGGISAIY